MALNVVSGWQKKSCFIKNECIPVSRLTTLQTHSLLRLAPNWLFKVTKQGLNAQYKDSNLQRYANIITTYCRSTPAVLLKPLFQTLSHFSSCVHTVWNSRSWDFWQSRGNFTSVLCHHPVNRGIRLVENMNSFGKRAGSSHCDSTSTIKLILYNATRAVTHTVELRVCVEPVGGGGLRVSQHTGTILRHHTAPAPFLRTISRVIVKASCFETWGKYSNM